MTDHKFTDEEEEVINCLCFYVDRQCNNCDIKDSACCVSCVNTEIRDALALINRQKAEITRLITSNSQLEARVCEDRAEIESLNAVHADMTESLRLAAEANKDMSAELKAMRGAANSYKMHYEEAERKYKIAVAEREANVEGFIETLKTIKAEAIKEFAEKLKKAYSEDIGSGQKIRMRTDIIDTLVKKMTEENK